MYRSHTNGELNATHINKEVTLAGWVQKSRDKGFMVWVDLRDRYGLTQVVVSEETAPEAHAKAKNVRGEFVIAVKGEVFSREEGTHNPKLATGDIEVVAKEVAVQSSANELPMPVAGEAEYPEEIRLKYRYLDLRRDRLHANIMLRSKVIASIRRRMIDQGFTEFQTPILTASSPEGARDYLVPSRIHPGKFYALPQAPQQFKQLIMIPEATEKAGNAAGLVAVLGFSVASGIMAHYGMGQGWGRA